MRDDAPARPVLSFPRSPLEIALGVVAAAALVGQVAVAAWYWERLPDRIPTHFGLDGRPDRWGSKATILALPIMSAVVVALLSVLERFPHAYNYPWPITRENAPRQYALARGLLAALKAALCVLFLALLVGICRAALVGGGLSGWFIVLGVGGIFAVVGGYMVLAYRAR